MGLLGSLSSFRQTPLFIIYYLYLYVLVTPASVLTTPASLQAIGPVLVPILSFMTVAHLPLPQANFKECRPEMTTFRRVLGECARS